MPERTEDDFRSQMSAIESMLAQVERFKNPAEQDLVRKLVSAILEIHAKGIDHILDHVASIGASGVLAVDAMANDDEIVGSLLLLHGLHPATFESRVKLGLLSASKSIEPHGGSVELLSTENGIIRLRIEFSRQSRASSSSSSLKQTIEQAILNSAPDAVAIEIEGLTTIENARAVEHSMVGFVPAESLLKRSARSAV